MDKFIESNPVFKSAKVLKTDTDGFDLMILRGGLNYIAKTSPVLFFEYSRTLLEGLGDDGLGTLNLLETMGYETAIFYDNFGRFILSTELKNKHIIEQLHFYMSEEPKKSAVPFYDICLFHQHDKQLAQEFIKEEMTFFKTVDY